MIPANLVETPRIVSERTDGHSVVYWMRTEEGDYRPVNQRFFRMMASARFGRQQLGSLSQEAIENHVEVRCIAGLEPGVHRDSHNAFLNPYSVPLVKPPAAESPSEKFRTIFNQCVVLQDENTPANKRQIERYRKKLQQLYCEARAVKPVTASRKHHPWTVIGKSYSPATFPCDDHCALFQGTHGYIWTSQPYGVEAAELLGFARLHGLIVTVSPEWSWYYPGRTALIEWSKDPKRRSGVV